LILDFPNYRSDVENFFAVRVVALVESDIGKNIMMNSDSKDEISQS